MALRKLSKILLAKPPSYRNPVIIAYHNVVLSGKYSDAPSATNTSTPRVFDRIKAVANADMVGKVNAYSAESALKKGLHTSAIQLTDSPPGMYDNVPQVFERIKAVANAAMVEKVKACYVFQLDGEGGKYYIDLKEGEGQVGEGDVPNKPANFKPEVKITMSQENMLKMFNRELAPATAFMTGKLKLSGDLSKALALEAILKAAREQAEQSK